MRKQWTWMAAALVLAAVSGCDREAARAGGGAAKDGPPDVVPGDSGPPPGQLPQGVTAAQGGQGRGLYRSACVMCHGETGQGTQLGPSLVDDQWSQGTGAYEEIIRVVTDGAPATEQFGVPMPPKGNGKFTDEQIRAVSAYTFSLARRGS